MTLAEMSAADEYTVGTVAEPVQDKCRLYPSGAHNPYDSEMRWILQAGNSCSICCRIAAPVAQKSENSRLKTHLSPPGYSQ